MRESTDESATPIGFRHWLALGALSGALLAGCNQRAGVSPDSANTAPANRGAAVAGPTSENSAADSAALTAQRQVAVDPPAISLQTLDFDGIERLVASHRGKVVVMDAWSTSCAPCLAEFPHLVELHRRHGPDRVACVSLSFDYEGLGAIDEVKPPVIKFLTEQAATFDNVISSEESDALYRKFNLASVPAVFVYDRAGKLRKRFDNQRAKRKEDQFTYAQVGQLVEELLSESEVVDPEAESNPAP